jgi:cytidylate kinase
MVIQVILLSGRSGVGKTSVANEISEQLRIRYLRHAHIDGDNLDMIYPEEHTSEILCLNLAAMWKNYHQHRGCNRLILSGTAMVLEHQVIQRTIEQSSSASSSLSPQGHLAIDLRGFILTASDEVASERLRQREIGSLFDHHLQSSHRMAAILEKEVGHWACRISTEGQSVKSIALQILEQAEWL